MQNSLTNIQKYCFGAKSEEKEDGDQDNFVFCFVHIAFGITTKYFVTKKTDVLPTR